MVKNLKKFTQTLDTFKQVHMSANHKVVIAIKGVQIFQQLASDCLMLSGDRWINMHYNNNNVLSQEDFCSYQLTCHYQLQLHFVINQINCILKAY